MPAHQLLSWMVIRPESRQQGVQAECNSCKAGSLLVLPVQASSNEASQGPWAAWRRLQAGWRVQLLLYNLVL